MANNQDKQIIALLQLDPHRSNKSISIELGISEVAVASRIRAMIDGNKIRFVAQRDIAAFGEKLIAHLDIFVEGRSAIDVATELGEIEYVSSVVLLSGSPQIIAQFHARDEEHLTQLINQSVAIVRGIERVESCISLDIIKFRTDVADLAVAHD